MKAQISTVLLSAIASALLANGTVEAATFRFNDSTMDPSQYEITTFKDPVVTVTTSGLSSGGFPGSVMSIITGIPNTSGAYVQQVTYLLSKNAAYDTATNGPIKDITLSIDSYFKALIQNFTYSGGAARVIIEQSGKIYEYGAALPAVQDAYLSKTFENLTSVNFRYVADLANLGYDFSMHPNFSTGKLRFGFVTAAELYSSIPLQVEQRYDNFSISVSSVPELSTMHELLLGIVALLVLKRRARY